MALKDVSKMVTGLERQWRFAEWFTRVFREPLSKALNEVFVRDLPDGEEAPEVLGMVDSLVRGLRSTFELLTGSERGLLASLKKEEILRKLQVKLTAALRESFNRARSACRASFGLEKAEEAGFPSRLAEDPLALLRQTGVVSFNLREPEFDLGENLVPGSNHDAETILGTFEPAARDLQEALDDGNKQRAVTQGKQVEKNDAMTSFKTTYGIYVAVVRGCFRLAGFTELAERLTLTVRGRSGGALDTDPPTDDPPADGTPDDRPADRGDVPEVPPEFADFVRLDGPAAVDENDTAGSSEPSSSADEKPADGA